MFRKLPLGSGFAATVVVLMACDGNSLDCMNHCDHPYNSKPGSCAMDDVPDGQTGGKCHDDWLDGDTCDPGGICVDNVCIPCGFSTELCCSSGTQCTQGNCSGVGDFPTCDVTCGTIGQSCCAGATPCVSGVCDENSLKCIDPPQSGSGGGIGSGSDSCKLQPGQDPCTVGGSTSFEFWLVNPNGCATEQPYEVMSTCASIAQQCAQNYAIMYFGAGSTTGPANTPPLYTQVCVTGTNAGDDPNGLTHEAAVYDTSKAVACELATLCSSPPCFNTGTLGMCSGGL